jgi:uncharacterized protein (TIGR03086 family)
MPAHLLTATAAAPTLEIIRKIADDQLAAPTPCSDYDVRKLVNHMLFWGPSLEGAARKEPVVPPADSEQDVDLTEVDWTAKLVAQVDRLASAWSVPEAWQGTARVGGPTEMPASMVGGMVFGEFVLHGWDLARATGQEPKWDQEVTEFVYAEVAKIAEQGRDMGVFGVEVAVPATASTLDRALGLSGRDPNWLPPSDVTA